MMISQKSSLKKRYAYVLLSYILFSYVFMLRVQEQKSKTYNTALREVYILPVIRQLFIPENKMSTNNEPPTQHLAHHFRYMAMYHKHCCARLIKAIQEKMPDGETGDVNNNLYKKNVSLFFNSIHGTMNHLLGGDEIWYGRINGSEVPKDIFPIYLLDGVELGRKWEERYENRNELFEKLIGQCDRWIELLKDKDDAWCIANITYHDTEGVATNLVRASGLTQVFNHGTHHRGQISAAFSKFNFECPSFDFQSLQDKFLKYQVV